MTAGRRWWVLRQLRLCRSQRAMVRAESVERVIISCPTCGRAEVDIVKLAGQVEQRLEKIDKPIKVAVMGCVVNGPGEAKDADVGIACGKGRGVIFKKGKKVGVVAEKDFLTALMKEVEEM